ncbi:MAG TPA: histidinol dehydrogenase [Baekduia sp.]|uniref:histidinol dehydrogenase n=1 Tax=Baekduia sp. TaxID=2600305 RepID=UPI002D798A0A|nr:histidinol dehydrogenase [Baekduia sp.]HET6506505.1 histidinol dehydrogenase [Baekduia sp.]
MSVERFEVEAGGGATAAAEALRALAPAGVSVSGTVNEIVASVRTRGEQALLEYVERFDGVTGALRVSDEELQAALAQLDPEVRAGLEVAIANVRAVAEAGLAADKLVELPQGQTVTIRETPVRRAAIYTPGGRNPYPSTVVMGVVTARAAGVDEVAVCAPGGHPTILAAAALCGADEVWRMGGAHAIAAFAYGTDSVPRVDVIAGPGSLYVQEAKRQVSGDVGIDGFAGPSDLLVLASADADAALVTADLVAQAEHGVGTIAALVTDDAALADDVAARLAAGQEGDAATAVVLASSIAEGLLVAEAFAPEHLELVGAGAEAVVDEVRSAGCVFVGRESGTAFGDYVAGSNHTLPTGGAARFTSGLSTRQFRRRMSVVRIDGAAGALAKAGVPIAEAEGFTRHAESMRVRENPPR